MLGYARGLLGGVDVISEGRRIDIFRKLIKPHYPKYELLSASAREAIITPYLRDHLEPLGLTKIRPRTWADGSSRPARRMFELILLKGASMRARWGFSLNFVPHLSGGRVRWHRSEKTAMLDVIIDPCDKALLEPSFIHGAEKLYADLKELLPPAVERAKEAWRRGATERGLLDLVQEIRTRNTNCFPFQSYTQLPLTYAFLSAKFGDLTSAEHELDCYLSRSKLENEAAGVPKNLVRKYASSGKSTE